MLDTARLTKKFQHTAARRRLGSDDELIQTIHEVSTHSRPKAAGILIPNMSTNKTMFQHTAARRRLVVIIVAIMRKLAFQHTAARRRLVVVTRCRGRLYVFQHTAARRRLVGYSLLSGLGSSVSTHSRPKAAGNVKPLNKLRSFCFNTQPPEGGWDLHRRAHIGITVPFQHTAARRRLGRQFDRFAGFDTFQHTAARRRLVSAFNQPFLTSCFNTQPPEGGWIAFGKAAPLCLGFNTQPPEGGWLITPIWIGGI